MKKKIAILVCGWLVLASSLVWAQEKEIGAKELSAATKVVEAYCQALTKGDLDKAMSYMTPECRESFNDDLNEIPAMRELSAAVLAKSQYKIVEAYPDYGDIEARVTFTMPNIEELCERIAGEMEQATGEPITFENAFPQVAAKAITELDKGNYKREDADILVLLELDDGIWRVSNPF